MRYKWELILLAVLGFSVNFCYSRTIYVGHNGGFDYNTITEALANAVSGDTILVADGNYNVSNGETFPLVMKNHITLKSRYPWESPKIDAQGTNRVFNCINLTNSFTTIIQGFRITGGSASGTFPSHTGGGLYLESSKVSILDCTIFDNTCTGSGGGMVIRSSTPLISNCAVESNSAGISGGGICITGSDVIIYDSFIRDNVATLDGGGLDITDSSPSIHRCYITNNFSGQNGGGIHLNNASPTLINNILAKNYAYRNGGGIFCYWNSNVKIYNCTLSLNSANLFVGGGVAGYGSYPIITNAILWDNSPNEVMFELGYATITYSDVKGGALGQGNINEVPKFVDPNSDFHIRDISPCIDKGTVIASITNDIDKQKRPNPDTNLYDMGADEFWKIPPVPTISFKGMLVLVLIFSLSIAFSLKRIRRA